MEGQAKREGVSFRKYLYEYLKANNEGVHGNVLNKVVDSLIN